MKSSIDLWKNENNQVLEDMFQRFLSRAEIDDLGHLESSGIELIITSDCNQKCEYCYLVKNEDKLYPKEFRNRETIKKNMKIFLAYLLENKKYPISFDLFSGEIWEEKFGLEILMILLEDYIKKCPKPPQIVCIPSNCSFILNDKVVAALDEIIDAYDFYGTRLMFSASVDGPILENENRSFKDSKKNQQKDDIFYTKLFEWCKKHRYGFHPMVNACAIEKWPEQHSWWVKKLQEYELDYKQYIMFLEVRNNEWTEDKIKSYLSFLNTCLDNIKQDMFKTDEEILKEGLFMKTEGASNYYHLFLGNSSIRQGCNVDRLIAIRLGDLSWVPCHRTSYEKFLYGKMKVENEKIVGWEALNLPLLFTIFGLGYGGHPKCDLCSIAKICVRGCYGAQYEAHKELFYPCSTVCDLYKAKNLFLYAKYSKMNEKIQNKEVAEQLDKIKLRLDGIEKEFIDKWNPYIQTLI